MWMRGGGGFLWGSGEVLKFLEERASILRKRFTDARIDPDPTPPDRLYMFGPASHSLLYSSLFVPDLQEVDGSVMLYWKLWDQQGREEFSRIKAQKAGNAREI